jgi:hypothetical protein
MRAPLYLECKERTMPNAAIAMNGLLEAEYFDFQSTHVGDTFRIFVAKPPFADKDKRYPAIYATDGNGAFPMVTSIQRTLAWGDGAPAAYVIGVGYPTEGGYLQAIRQTQSGLSSDRRRRLCARHARLHVRRWRQRFPTIP